MTNRSGAFYRHWKPQAAREARGTSGKRGKVVAVLAAVLALTGAIAAWLLYPSPFHRPHFVAMWIDQYSDRAVPAHRWASQDRAALRSLSWQEQNTFTSQERGLLVQELHHLKSRTPQDAVVIALSAFAATTPEGELCVLPGDARLDQPSTWLSLREVLALIQACPARHKLLLLDLMQPFTDPPSGIFAYDVAVRLHPLLEELVPQDKYLRVLCACSPGQVSLASEELGHTVFGYFLLQGLRGRADGHNPSGSMDGRVSVLELADYVRTQVDRWAWQNRRTRQTPLLLGATEDFPLVVTVDQAPAEDAPLELTYPAWLSAGWQRREDWWKDQSFRVAPAAFRQLETALLRTEEAWRGGADPVRIEDDLKARLQQLDRQRRDKLAAVERPEPRSLAQAVAQGRKPPDTPDTVLQVRELAALSARAGGPKASEADKKKLAEETEALLKKFENNGFEMAWIAVEALTSARTTPEGLRYVADLLARGKVSPFTETQYLQRLLDIRVDNPADWPAEEVQLGLQVGREAERASAADNEALLWVGSMLADAGRHRQAGERALFDPAARASAKRDLLAARDGYRKINTHLQTIQDAQRRRDEARVLLPAYVAYLDAEGGDEKVWEGAVETARGLDQLLKDPHAEMAPVLEERVRKMGDLAESLQDGANGLRKLRQSVEEKPIRQLIDRRRLANPTDAMAMSALLALPWLAPKNRVELWTAWREIGAALNEKPLDREVPSSWDVERDRAVEAGRKRALARARRSLVLLKFQGATGLEKLTEALEAAEKKPGDAAREQALSRELRQAWGRYRARSE
jgi:hypothetical protein